MGPATVFILQPISGDERGSAAGGALRQRNGEVAPCEAASARLTRLFAALARPNQALAIPRRRLVAYITK